MFRSLRFRLWLLLLLTTGVTLFLTGWFYYHSARTTIHNALLENATAKVAANAESLSVWVQTRIQQLESLASDETVRFGEQALRQARLERVLQRDGAYESLVLRDREGGLLASAGGLAGAIPAGACPRSGSDRPAVSGPFPVRSFTLPHRAIAVQIPVLDVFGTAESYLCATVRADAILADTVEFEMNMRTNAALVNDRGGIVYAPDGGDAWKNEALLRLAAATQGKEMFQLQQGGNLFIGSAVEGTGWHLVVQISTDRLYAPLHRLLLLTIAAGVAAEAALAVLLYLLIRPLLNRIKAILKKTEAVAAGQFRVSPLAIDKEDEIGALAASVNGMVEQLRRLFEPLQAVTHQSDYGIVVTDEAYVITQFNESAERILGYAADELVGRHTPLVYADPADSRALAERLSDKRGRKIEPGLPYLREQLLNRPTITEDRIFVHKDGAKLPVHLNVSKILDDQGRVTGYVGLFRDITRQIGIQAELIEAKLEAERANEAKSSFLARMSHEIRTPINGIVGFTQLLERTPLSDAQRGYVQKIASSSEALLGTVNHILDFSKIEAGKFELEQVPFDVDDLIRKLADTLSIFLGPKPVEMIFDIPDDVPARLLGDPLRLEQVLLNLTNNAIKFTEQGYVLLKVRARDRQPGSVALHFSVTDTGIGIRDDQLAQLFQPFVQADGSTSRKYGGSGLGLVIADEMVALMGGQLEVESKPGVGSRFFFELTFPVESAARKIEPSASLHRSILCIERPGLMQQTLLNMLMPIRDALVFADSWTDAIALLDSLPKGRAFDYVMFNMEMADMDGESTWLRLRTAARGARTVAMTTTLGQAELLRMAEEDRPDRSLIKPINRRSLRLVLAGLEEERRHDREHPPHEPAATEGPVPVRVLVVEDHEINQEIARELLADRGFEVGVAADGYEALRMAAEQHWDLVLMDVHMPALDGYEATRRLREIHPAWSLPIVAMTANVMAKDRRKCYEVGMNDVITKPIQAAALYEVVRRWVATARAVDWGEAGERVNGKTHILRRMVQRFRRDYADFADRLTTLLERGERDRALRLLHTFRGVTSNLSAKALYAAATRLERELAEAREGDAGLDGPLSPARPDARFEARWRAQLDVLTEALEPALCAMALLEQGGRRSPEESNFEK
ncbi:response regulator [Cohnella sp. REN36]|uniref:response regulator n=1 Tax=Cohnella sp. REN36 TaxID=2887347 RepID=UPI001D14DCBB|nr:response regulator [Cohnella sp. REN36]MCC3372984.1 response regulator [Cohnella sp. REN36]